MDDTVIRQDLETIQPDPIDIKGTISPEEVTNVAEVPRGSCKGTLLSETTTSPATPSGKNRTGTNSGRLFLYFIDDSYPPSGLQTEIGDFTGIVSEDDSATFQAIKYDLFN